jgi:hypothetical protein
MNATRSKQFEDVQHHHHQAEFRPLHETMPDEFGADAVIVLHSLPGADVDADEAGRREARPAILELCSTTTTTSDCLPLPLPLRRLISGYSRHDHLVARYHNREMITEVVRAVFRLLWYPQCSRPTERIYLYDRDEMFSPLVSCEDEEHEHEHDDEDEDEENEDGDEDGDLHLHCNVEFCFSIIDDLPPACRDLVRKVMELWDEFKRLPRAVSTVSAILRRCNRLPRHLDEVFDEFDVGADGQLSFITPKQWRRLRQESVWMHENMLRPTLFWERRNVAYEKHPTVSDQWICVDAK